METYIEQHMLESLKDQELREITGFGPVRIFRLERAGGGRMMSTQIVFTTEGIIIHGDLCPRPAGNRGVISDFGYGLDWFAGQLGESYLCEKFLRKEWQCAAAAQWCEAEAAGLDEEDDDDGRDEATIKRFLALCDLAQNLRLDEINEDEFHSRLADIDPMYSDARAWSGVSGIGYDYPRGDAGWLCAIQQKFAELYAQRQNSASGSGITSGAER